MASIHVRKNFLAHCVSLSTIKTRDHAAIKSEDYERL